MLSLDSISDEVLDRIAELIGHRLQRAPIKGLTGGARLEMSETIAITELPTHAGDWEGGLPDFRGRWFHLLKSGPRYVGYALSTPIGPAIGDWMIEGVFRSGLSAQMATCLRWMDKNIDGNGTVRLLVEPGHHLHAFTITAAEGIRVVIAHLPRKTDALRKRKIYSWVDFLAHLSATAPVRGVETDIPTRSRKRVAPRTSTHRRTK